MRLIAFSLVPASLATISAKFFEMQSEHAEAHMLGLSTKILGEFKEFETTYAKIYDRDERKIRAQIFKNNFEMIEEHNSKPEKTWTMGVNEVSNYLLLLIN